MDVVCQPGQRATKVRQIRRCTGGCQFTPVTSGLFFAKEEEAQSFVKDDGQCFRSGTIRKRLTEIFQAAGVRLDRRIIKHCYLFREDHVLKQLLIMTHHEVRNVCRTDLHVRRHVVDFSMIKEISDFVRLRTNSAWGSQFSRQGDLPFENDSSLGASTGLSRRPWPTAEARGIGLLSQKGEVRYY